jgi:putative methanogenesis marker protein 6
MTDYRPRYAGTVTKYVFIESPDKTPSDLAIRAYEISQGVMIKETCFGLQITGSQKDVDSIITRLREVDPAHIFVKDRGFPPGDPRRCRANLGGARPGYYGHEFEISLIRYVTNGIEELPRRDEAQPVHPPQSAGPARLDAKKLQEIIELQES